MARADRRRAQRAKAPAVARRSQAVIEDTMFFPRLRRHAKWVFVFLALAVAQPRNPTVQAELAETARSVGDSQTAIAAYKKFLKLAPDDPSAPDVRRILKQLGAK